MAYSTPTTGDTSNEPNDGGPFVVTEIEAVETPHDNEMVKLSGAGKVFAGIAKYSDPEYAAGSLVTNGVDAKLARGARPYGESLKYHRASQPWLCVRTSAVNASFAAGTKLTKSALDEVMVTVGALAGRIINVIVACADRDPFMIVNCTDNVVFTATVESMVAVT